MIRDGSKLPEDDLTAPLGTRPQKTKTFALAAVLPQAMAGALGLFILVFILWAAIVHDPLGGEPMAVVAINQGDVTKGGDQGKAAQVGPNRYDGPAPGTSTQPPAASASGSRTVTIIDGTSGKRQDVIIPDSDDAKRAPIDPKLLEASRHGPIPRVAQDGTRPADSYARPIKTAHGGPPMGPRVVLVIGGLGIGIANTNEAISKLPAPVTLAFTPYGNDIDKFVARARNDNHEVLLQLPMEPFDYPDNDPGPQTLLSTLAGEQNVDRLHWLFSRFQGYVGVTNYMGARFTASEQAMAPVLREVARRGLIYVDDGSSPRSVADQIAGANNLPFAKADVVIDAVSSPAEIDKALARLEAMARDRGLAVGYGSALPITIERVAAWCKAAQNRGIILAPVSAAAVKAKSST
jgi:polysaccharide deacetylase 2 family uncharacterized protein YibQ